MAKYLSGRVKRTPQDRLTDDRYTYLGLEQTEPNLGDPSFTQAQIPAGSQYQLISVVGSPGERFWICLLYTSPSPRDRQKSRMPSSA